MIKNKTIRKIAAFNMLIIFALSITPTVFLHNQLAHHSDSAVKRTENGQQQFSKGVFNCHCDNLVAQSPFTDTESIAALIPQIAFARITTENITEKPVYRPIFLSLRGPPST